MAMDTDEREEDLKKKASELVDEFLGKEHDDPREALVEAVREALGEIFEEGKDEGEAENADDDAATECETQLVELVRDLSGKLISDAGEALEWLTEKRDEPAGELMQTTQLQAHLAKARELARADARRKDGGRFRTAQELWTSAAFDPLPELEPQREVLWAAYEETYAATPKPEKKPRAKK